MKTIDKRKIRGLLVMVLLIVVLILSLNVLIPRPLEFREIFFNLLFLAAALIALIPLLVFYPVFRSQLKDWSLLVGAGYLIFMASSLFGLYDEWHRLYSEAYDLTPEEKAVQTRLTENLNILRYVVPGVMVGVAANLITIFIHPSNSDKPPSP